MNDDSLTRVCEDLLQLRDEVAQSEFRPSAEDICHRLTAAVTRIEACYSQPQQGVSDGKEVDGGGIREESGSPPPRTRRPRGRKDSSKETGASGAE